ncbi:MAG: GntR family transcriptional regulator [Candidatus Methylopumilus sp.]
MVTTNTSSILLYQPLYEQIKRMLTQSLIDGEWKAGEMIPSEMELAARFKVSQGTVRKAIDELVSENILMRRQGKGTFVHTHNEEGMKLRFLRLTGEDGKKAFPKNELLSCTRGKANAKIAKKLNLKTGASIIEIKRLLGFEGRPLIFDHIIVPSAEFAGLGAKQIEAYKGSLYRMYEQEYDIRMVRAEEDIRAVGAEAEAAQALNLAQGAPLLRIERVAFTYGDRPLEWRLGLCLTDSYHYRNELE